MTSAERNDASVVPGQLRSALWVEEALLASANTTVPSESIVVNEKRLCIIVHAAFSRGNRDTVANLPAHRDRIVH